MKFLLILSCFVACPLLIGQSMRTYIFIAPTFAGGGSPPSNIGFGVLPPPSNLTTSITTSNNWYGAGGGFEPIFGNHLGAGLDLAALLPGQGKVGSNTFGVISPGVYLHSSPSGKDDFYLTGGYSLFVADFTANGLNVGGGWNHWFHENLAFSLEVRELFLPGYTWPHPPDRYYTQIRFGLTFR